jgi:3-phenylpropionate/trans-cinnamate dioxygenase ferredoxin reductase subunit
MTASASFGIVIVGAGHAAGELATALRQEGYAGTVAMIGQEPWLPYQRPPLSKSFLVGQVTTESLLLRSRETYDKARIDVLLDTSVSHIDRAAPADLVIAGVGIQPNIELAGEAGLEVGDGILVAPSMRTSDPAIVALGDCANHPNAAAGCRLRLESVPNAVEQARVAAATLCGKPRSYDAVPWFWSDQYDLKLQMVGISRNYDELVVRGETAGRSFMAFYLQSGRVIAADAIDRPAEFMVAKRLVAARLKVTARSLADESSPLRTLLKS